jgi:hypothetical protein
MTNGLFKIRNTSKVHNNDQIVLSFQFNDEQTGLHNIMCKRRECVIGQVNLKLLSKRLAVAMMNKTVVYYLYWLTWF